MRDLSRTSGMSLAGPLSLLRIERTPALPDSETYFHNHPEQLTTRLDESTEPEHRIRIFHSQPSRIFFWSISRAMKVLSHEDEALKNGLGSEIATIKREYYRICPRPGGTRSTQARPQLRRAHRRHEPVRHDELDSIPGIPPRRRQRGRNCARMGDIFLRGVISGQSPRKSGNALEQKVSTGNQEL